MEESIRLYQDLGLNIIPLAFKTKKPLVEWDKYQERKVTNEEINHWFSNKEDINVAVITGKISENLVVIDFDKEDLYYAFFKEHLRLEKNTIVIKTSRGMHVYFKTKLTTKSSKVIFYKDGQVYSEVSIKGEGGYVVAPPSTHPSGIQYKFLNDVRIIDFNDGDITQELQDRARLVAEELKLELKLSSKTIYIKELIEGTSQGIRNDWGIKLATYWRVKGKSKLDCFKFLKAWNENNKPALSESELRTISDSAYRQDKPYGYVFDDGEEITKIQLLFAEKATKQQGSYLMAKYLIKKYGVVTLGDQIYTYHEGIYIQDGKAILAKETEEALGDRIDSHWVKEIMERIKRITYYKSIEENPEKLCLNNGILDLKTFVVESHTPDLIFFNKLPINYDPNMDCVRIRQFLSEVVSEENIELLQEIIGYCLYKSYPIQKAFMFVGTGANGKSTFFSVLSRFIGEDNCANVPLQTLGGRFNTSRLQNKLINIVGDLSGRDLKETAWFKQLTGGDHIQAEKKFQEGFSFKNYAKLLFSCNQVPEIESDDTDAVYRRWRVVMFPNQFISDKADKKLLAKLTTSEEMSGLLNFAIVGLRRLLEIGSFTRELSIDESRVTYMRQASTVMAFREDCLELGPEAEVVKQELFSRYKVYCHSRKFPAASEQKFFKDIYKLIPTLDEERVGIGKNRVKILKGIKIIEAGEPFINESQNTNISVGTVDRMGFQTSIEQSYKTYTHTTYNTHSKRDIIDNNIESIENIDEIHKPIKLLSYRVGIQNKNIAGKNIYITEATFLPCGWCGLKPPSDDGWKWKDEKGKPVCQVCATNDGEEIEI